MMPNPNSAPGLDAGGIHVGTHFSPYGPDYDRWNCRTCTHAIGHGAHHLWCSRTRIVAVAPCGAWEREPGTD